MPHQVDVYVGKRIRHRRWMTEMTQQQLAEAVGIKFQQIQKYETGMNRVSASRLWEIAKAMDVSVSYFFEGLDDDASARPGMDPATDKETMQLVRSYYALPDAQRRQIFELARVLAAA